MNEEETEKDKSEDAAKDTGEGVQSETNRTVDDINLAAKRMEEATEKMKVENDRTENNYAKMKVGGRAEAGSAPVKPKEETPKEYNDRIEKETSEGKHNE